MSVVRYRVREYMKLPTISPNSIQIKPVLICFTCLFLVSFIGISMISLKSKGFTARKLLGLRGQPKFCAHLSRHESVNWNYFYYYKNPATQQELIWCKVPKAGSTTLTKLFLRLAGSKRYNNNTRVHKLLRDFYPRLPNHKMWDIMKTSKTFMIVRDPFERILSAYRDKLENYQRDLIFRDGYYYEHYGKSIVKSYNKRNKTISTNSTAEIHFKNSTNDNNNGTIPSHREPTWKEFVSYLIKTPVGRFDEHWMPITRLCSPCSMHFDYIIKMENFDLEIQKPLSSAGITSLDLGKNHITGTANKRLVEKYFKKLTLNEVKKLYTKYKRDFLLFGYTPFKYFRMTRKNDKFGLKANQTSETNGTNSTTTKLAQFGN